jgi:hypothetical protein
LKTTQSTLQKTITWTIRQRLKWMEEGMPWCKPSPSKIKHPNENQVH